MGRSENSRNRVFDRSDGYVWTKAADPTKLKDPSLIIYNAMLELNGLFVVTNGDQTDTIIQSLRAGGTFRQALATRQYEPDAPNFTPRISALTSVRDGMPMLEMAVLKQSPISIACDRFFYVYDDLPPGYGRMITTYAGDGDPLPCFQGEPMLMPLSGGIEEIADTYWKALNEDNRVALAVKFIDVIDWTSETVLVNRHS